MVDDPIVEEVRKHRLESAVKFGSDVRAIAEDARAREKAGGHPFVSFQETDAASQAAGEKQPAPAARRP